jgi:anti-sigma regulatory factor (Ser/Thr protein kinase)
MTNSSTSPWPASRRSVAEAREAVEALARLGGAPVIDVKIAVSEAVGNSVIHAYRNRDHGSITVQARYERVDS